MSQETLTIISALQPIAKNLRDRQIEIDNAAKRALGEIAGIINSITEQGRDILNAKTHLGRVMAWSEWLENHVPNLPAKTAAKYERITVEGITDPRQAVFAFMPEPDRRELPKRSKPTPWEVGWGYAHRLISIVKAKPIHDWPSQQREYLAQEIEPLAKALWPDRFKGPTETVQQFR